MGYLLLFPRMTVKILFGILTFQIHLKVPAGWDYGSWFIDTPVFFLHRSRHRVYIDLTKHYVKIKTFLD